MRKRCPEHGRFAALVYGDANAHVANARFNKPGTIPLAFTQEVNRDASSQERRRGGARDEHAHGSDEDASDRPANSSQ